MAQFQFGGINHLALVCEDMDVTVDFYTRVLGMRLTKTITLPGDRGKHFFFDAGNGDALAFFWFPEGPEKVSRKKLQQISATPGTMNHVAFDVPADKIEAYQKELVSRGVEVTEVVNHDDGPTQASPTLTPSTFVRSIYFHDPDGIMLEFAAWTRPLDGRDVDESSYARLPAEPVTA